MSKVYFSSVWEDYNSLKEGLHPSENDTILSVSSSGDNVFNFVSDKVKKVIAVDLNPAQLNIAKLKLKIISKCDSLRTSELLTGAGNKTENKIFIDTIVDSDEELKRYLSVYNFEKGVDNIGEFENKALPIITFFARKFFKKIDFESDRKERRKANIWLKILPILFSFKKTYKFLLPDFPYQYININIGKSLKKGLSDFLTLNDLSNNWYLQKIYFGKYKLLPPFLRSGSFQYLKDNLDKITFAEKDVLNFLKQSSNNSIDKIDLSDIFDWCSEEEYSQILQEAHRVLTPNGKMFYWELFVSRELPKDLQNNYESLTEESDRIHRRDNLPFYNRIVILKKKEFAAKETGRSVGALKSATGGVVQVLPQGGVDISDYGSYDTQSKNKDEMVTVRATFSIE